MSFPFADASEVQEALLCPLQEKPYRPTRQPIWTQLNKSIPYFLLTFVIAMSIGIFIGRQFIPFTSQTNRHINGDLPEPVGDIHQVWQHNLTFSQPPTPQSEAAWASIIPAGRGFIHHEPIAPFISNIAVFHQLHCLHAILVAYYTTNPSTAVPAEYNPETGARTALPHVRHCFDYLRRTLMCYADTNLEVLDRETHTTNGWGQKKVCRDYDAVVSVAERWANSTDEGITAIDPFV